MRSGFVPVVGRPNVGKSSLINALVGEKVAIVSERPQTTRARPRGVVHRPSAQIVLVDTPGLHRPRTALGERLNRRVDESIGEADAAILVVEATDPIGPGDRTTANRLRDAAIPTVCVVNKVDAASKAEVVVHLAEAGEWGMEAYIPVSAHQGTNLEAVVEAIVAVLPEGPAFYPAEMTSDQPEEVRFAEIVREKFLDRLREELPHSLAVIVDDVIREPDLCRVHGRLIVERDSQKGIVIGSGGTMLRDRGTEARREIESIVGGRVHLDLRVEVEPRWQQRPESIDRLGL